MTVYTHTCKYFLNTVMEFLLMGINQTVKIRFQMYALYVFSLVVR